MGILLLALVLAPFVYRIFHSLFVEPLVYYAWVVGQMIRVIPESYYWLFIIACLGLLTSIFLVKDIHNNRKISEDILVTKGPVEFLSDHIEQSARSNYFKWILANRLANLALQIQHSDNIEAINRHAIEELSADGLSQKVHDYLKTGMLSSFMDFRHNRKWWKKTSVPPFDVNINDVINFLESQMES
jgi:hypothetical protein